MACNARQISAGSAEPKVQPGLLRNLDAPLGPETAKMQCLSDDYQVGRYSQ
jgi:hypothetical protein